MIERAAEYKSEYYDGEMVAMAGASGRHSKILSNLNGQLYVILRGTPCSPFAGDLRVKAPAASHNPEYRRLKDVLSGKRTNYLYPDLMVVCGEAQFEEVDHLDTLVNPTAIFEILSDSTERRDRGVKWRVYQQLETLRHYVMVSQWEPCVEIYTRKDDGDWVLHTVTDPTGSFNLSAINVDVAIADLYEGVPVEPDPIDQAP